MYVATASSAPAGNKKVIDFLANPKKFSIAFPYEKPLVEAVRQLPGRTYDDSTHTWFVPATGSTFSQIRKFAMQNGFTFSAAAEKIMNEVSSGQALFAKAQIAVGLDTPGHFGLGCILRPYQKTGILHILEHKQVLLGDEMGTGKTVIALAALHIAQAYPFLVVCPASLKINWQRETQKWLPGKNVAVVDGKNIRPIFAADVVIINYDILTNWKDQLKKMGFKGIVLDESHYIKGYSTKRTIAAVELAKTTDYRIALSGTPLVNRPKELIPQLTAIGRIDDFGGRYAFLNRYCGPRIVDGNKVYDMALHKEELHQKLNQSGFLRRTKAEVLADLPPLQRTVVTLDIPNNVNYNAACKALNHSLVNRSIQAPEPTLANPSNHIFAQIERLKMAAALAKIDYVIQRARDILDSGQKMILFAVHLEIVKKLVEELGEDYQTVWFTGESSVGERQMAIDRFQNEPDTCLIVTTIKAGGNGITLTAASYVGFIELDWTSAAHDQAEARPHRIGQANLVNAEYFLAKNTIDEDIYEIMDGKRTVINQVIDGRESDPSVSVFQELVDRLVAKARVK